MKVIKDWLYDGERPRTPLPAEVCHIVHDYIHIYFRYLPVILYITSSGVATTRKAVRGSFGALNTRRARNVIFS